MKKKGIIIIVLAVIIIGVVGGFLFINKDKNKSKVESKETFITMDINPSIEMRIKDNKIKEANAVNEDARDLIDGLEGKSIEESFNIVVKNAKEHDYAPEGDITIILGMEENNKAIEDTLRNACEKNELKANIIVPQITETAKNEAKARGITAAKAAYIMDIVKENGNLNFEDMVDKSSSELNEMKNTRKYCDKGYTLNGDSCERVIKEEKPSEGKTCPTGYEDANGKCYKTVPVKFEPYCKDGLTLKNGKCVGTVKVNANGKCQTGTYNSKTTKCEVLTYVSGGTKTCKNQNMDPKDRMMSNGKCSGAKWAHDDNTCEGNDIFVSENSGPNAGWCYNPSGDYDPTITCPSGTSLTTGDKGKGCYKSTTSDPTYYCSNGTLEGNKCIVDTTKNPENKLYCDEGLTLYKDRVCLNYNESKDYIIVYTCEKDARLVNNTCKYYEQVQAKES